jgi:hypothetical protein
LQSAVSLLYRRIAFCQLLRTGKPRFVDANRLQIVDTADCESGYELPFFIDRLDDPAHSH